MGILYDAKVLRDNAEKLYKSADDLVASARLLAIFKWGGAVGVGEYLFAMQHSEWTRQNVVSLTFGLFCVGGFIGSVFASMAAEALAQQLRVQAQTALCQVQIEENTQRATESGDRTA
jgi:hypothetical protein